MRTTSLAGRYWGSDIDNLDETRELIEAVAEFTSSANQPFTSGEVIASLKGRFNIDPEGLAQMVEGCLANDPWTFSNDGDPSFTPRQNFFRGKKFLVSPTPLELKNGFLIPGHRFIPFVQRYLPPCEYTVYLNDQRLEYKQVRLSLQELQIYYSLFDYSRTVEFLVMEDENNADVLLQPSVDNRQKINLWVLDMGNLFRFWPEGGILEVTVKNWRDGVYSMRTRPNFKSETTERKQENWCHNLEKILLSDVFSRLGPMTDLTEQLAQAMYRGAPSLWRTPQRHIGGMLTQLVQVSFTRVNGVPIFWREDESPEDVIFNSLRPEVPLSGVTDSMDNILYDIGCSLRESELEAYMRDELFHGGKSLDRIMNRALKYRGELAFINEEQGRVFDELVDKLWNDVNADYNRFADQRGGKCRAECLQILDSVVSWMNKLDDSGVGMDNLPKKEFVAISSLVTMITHTVSALNMDPSDMSSEELTALRRALGPLRGQAEQLMQSIDQQVFSRKKPAPKPKHRPRFRVIQGGLSDKK